MDESQTTYDDQELDSTLKGQELELIKDKEIERILSTFKLDYYSILDVQPGISVKDITKLYRKKSLLIHPDKSTNPKASDAFDLLKKASKILTSSDDENDLKEKSKLDEIWSDSRRLLIKENNWSNDDERLKSSNFLKIWRLKVKELLVEEEFLKRLELKKSQELESKKRLNEELELNQHQQEKLARDKWETNRDERVNHWRDFNKKLDNKKTKKRKLASKVLI
ncbi:hypothetical protein CANARDRAFT_28084 [[Candida] arabinofermentans NRRL YB-2248]|uniref:J domain-containing protein n=1 Tax=[Candida] arabinofermentans NRRL YB-2248 TaxID=983967 RepID=A0A1E4T2Q5_9ASCO|nr:hypothetical protein CANARDRAFT_28084 [[Candida] arabinofermentans NRRL YB-2248]